MKKKVFTNYVLYEGVKKMSDILMMLDDMQSSDWIFQFNHIQNIEALFDISI